MSRIGKKSIELAKNVEIKVVGQKVSVKGPKGALEREFHETVTVEVVGSNAHVKQKSGQREDRKFHGLSRTLLANMVNGVTTGFSKSLTLIGVGYRAAQSGKTLTLNVGYSHPIDFVAPQGIEIKVDKQTNLLISGPEKEVVGQVAATIRGFRPPEPYHGKGIRYSDEVIVTKVGKAAGKK
ncbi:MAG: 50S ribosomal protein L6 [Proteobacteria bacterium]|nr:50S ribosomal protein L6 [Pseudomonadota bacterium]